MALDSLFKTIKSEGYVLKQLDQYLLGLNNNEESDRAINVNSPSAISSCMRSRYYARTGAERDANSIEPRLRRIFDNGTGVHERLQAYLTKQGMLLMDEVPLRNDYYNIQGHSDGLLDLTESEIGVYEIKSIKSENFKKLKDAEHHHKEQASIYMYCAEERRKHLRRTYSNIFKFVKSKAERVKYFESIYQHLDGGKKYTKEEKIQMQVELNLKADKILFNTKKPITKVFIMYEDKNCQEIKEFCIEWDNSIIYPLLEGCKELNRCVEESILPNREGTKSSQICRWCCFKGQCFIL